ncbi:MAG: hypothetical protein IKJ63_09750 [Clostridia bacterium]|nr:hypothetical protein [Oscillospiraceae bacterium]MBQ3518653.1 hypothetical protein [Clostridia bacterium]MBR2414407.1 hypothetical protein [Clostridia bacterium]MBR3955742.1 hypothetical protein [Clostridia bacterium]
MIGIGKWLCKVNSMFYRGEVTLNIADNNGEYDITLEIDADFDMPDYKIYDVTTEGNTVTAKAEVSLLPGKVVDVSFTIENDVLSGVLKVPFMGKIKVTDGHKIA